MQIHSISKILALPLIVMASIIMFISYNQRTESSILIFIPVVLLVVLYVFHGPLDHWWLTKFPLSLDPKLKLWLSKHYPFYQNLDADGRKKFEYRLVLYLEGRLFQSVGSELKSVPEDIKCMVAAHAIEISFHSEDYLIGDIDRIYLYKHPFPSPNFPFLHTVELNLEDGVVLLSLEQLANAILFPSDYYNIAYHAYVEGFIGTNTNITFPNCEDTWSEVEKVSGWSQSVIKAQTGLENISLLHVHLVLFFSKRNYYKTLLPDLYQTFNQIFKIES